MKCQNEIPKQNEPVNFNWINERFTNFRTPIFYESLEQKDG